MTLHTLRGGMTHITASEIPFRLFGMAVFTGIGHPVATGMGDGLLRAMAVRTVGSGMAGDAEPSVVRGLLTMAAGLPAQNVILGLLRPVAILAETLLVVMTELA